MKIPEDVINSIQIYFHHDISIKNFSPVGGGCINNSGLLQTSRGDFFLKWNDAKKYHGMFQAEAKGLKLLGNTNTIRIPVVTTVGEKGEQQFILMEHIKNQPRSKNYWEVLGKELASLHQSSDSSFGLDHDNYMGSLPQLNAQKNSWIEFFIVQRLEVQLKIATDSRAIENSLAKKFNALYKKLPSILHEEKPSLVHGDLWNGNLITDEKGNPCLIDPAAYYGHREIDLAMTQLFGGFNDAFYQSYQNAHPTLPGLQERLDIYNLYPLLVHVNLFGQSYLSQVNTILRMFV